MKRVVHVYRCPACKARHRGTGDMLCQCGIVQNMPRCCIYRCKAGPPCIAVLIDDSSYRAGFVVKFYCQHHKPLLAIGEPVTQEEKSVYRGNKPIQRGAKRHVSRERDGKTHS